MSSLAAAEKHVVLVLDHSGHTEVAYAPDDAAAIAEAEKVFAKAKADGGLAYSEDRATGEREQLHGAFDPNVAVTLVSPAFAGG